MLHPISCTIKQHPRAVLTATQAIEIYSYRKVKSNGQKTDSLLSGRSAAVAKKFNVSPKAIRDIWNRRTWSQETKHLWTDDERPMIRQERLHRDSFSISGRVSAPTPYSLECVVDCGEAWWRPDCPTSADGCSVYTDDSEQQNHFHSLSLWSQLLVSSSTPSADLPCFPKQSCSAAHPPSQHSFISVSAGPHAETSLPSTGMAAGEEDACVASPWADAASWSAETADWSDSAERIDAGPFGAEGAPDPFSLDWPAW